MVETLLVLVPAWLILAVLGWAVLGLLPSTQRNLLLPASPVVGIALMVAVLHYTTLLVSVRVGVWALLPVLAGLLAVNFAKDRHWWAVPRSALLLTLLAAALGAFPATVVLAPTAYTGDSAVVQGNNNNDAFFYVAVIDWLTNNSGIEAPIFKPLPDDGGAPPSYLPAGGQIGEHLRIGQELSQSALS
jgi:hypothetical protein